MKYDLIWCIAAAALALSIDNDGLWTADKDFDKQNKIKVWKTKDLI
ncbi:MAG: hypothetical protein J4432_05530 [DPANN group archaeon]|nr:hypothetical protein [DPANN group archaeon]